MLLGLSFQKWLRKMQLTFPEICVMSIPQGALILPGFGLGFRCAVLPAFCSLSTASTWNRGSGPKPHVLRAVGMAPLVFVPDFMAS